MRSATRERSKKKNASVEQQNVEVAERELWHVPPAESRERRRERRAARRARTEPQTAPSEPTPVVMSPWVPIVWFVLPLVLVVVWTLIDGWLHP